MATSGSYDYGATAADIIQAALEDIGVFEAGETVDSNDSTVALRTLNFIVKQWQGTADRAPGLKVFSRARLTLFLAEGQQRYLIGPATTDARCTAQYGRTTLGSAYVSGTTLNITSNTDTTTYPGTTVTMTSGDFLGLVLDDGTIHWTTISGTPAATATIAGGASSGAASGNFVYWFTSRAQRFPVLETAVLREFDTTTFGEATDTRLEVYTEVAQYEAIPDKTADGDPTALLVEPLRITTAVTFDTQPDDVTKVVNMTVLYPSEDYDATTNDIAYPQEYFLALEWQLALFLAPKFRKKWTDVHQAAYNSSVPIAMQLNAENTTMYFQPGLE
jgi:hypothetical protein